jgi:flagellar protein FlaG
MNIDAVNTTNVVQPRASEASAKVDLKRQTAAQEPPSSAQEESKAQPEELLNQIKAITEDGLYSVRFEQDSSSEELVVKIVDSKTDEVIRQIPPEELINLSKQLKKLSGSIINTVS